MFCPKLFIFTSHLMAEKKWALWMCHFHDQKFPVFWAFIYCIYCFCRRRRIFSEGREREKERERERYSSQTTRDTIYSMIESSNQQKYKSVSLFCYIFQEDSLSAAVHGRYFSIQHLDGGTHHNTIPKDVDRWKMPTLLLHCLQLITAAGLFLIKSFA